MNEISKTVDVFRGAQWNNALSISAFPTYATYTRWNLNRRRLALGNRFRKVNFTGSDRRRLATQCRACIQFRIRLDSRLKLAGMTVFRNQLNAASCGELIRND